MYGTAQVVKSYWLFTFRVGSICWRAAGCRGRMPSGCTGRMSPSPWAKMHDSWYWTQPKQNISPRLQAVLRILTGFNADPNTDPDPDPSFWWPKTGQLKIFYIYFIDKKFQFTYSYASIKDVQATQEKSSSLKREHLALKNLNFLRFLWVIFGPPGSGSVFPMRIRTQPTKMNPLTDW